MMGCEVCCEIDENILNPGFRAEVFGKAWHQNHKCTLQMLQSIVFLCLFKYMNNSNINRKQGAICAAKSVMSPGLNFLKSFQT